MLDGLGIDLGSNNTNKLSPQEHKKGTFEDEDGSNNTNKLSPQELTMSLLATPRPFK